MENMIKEIYVICRIVKNCDRGLENAARGRGQHFQAQGLSFSPYVPTLSREITCLFFFSCSNLALKNTNGFVYAALVIQWACAPSTNDS